MVLVSLSLTVVEDFIRNDFQAYLMTTLDLLDLLRYRMTIHSQQHVLVMWSLAFYIRENFQEEVKDSDFAARMFQV